MVYLYMLVFVKRLFPDTTFQYSSHVPFIYLTFQIVINVTSCSEYVIRTQPDKKCLCTAECAAISLAFFEKNQLIQEVCVRSKSIQFNINS